MQMRWIRFSIFLIVLAWVASPLRAQARKISFLPIWCPQAQFTGFYAAQDKGIYKKYGLDVTLLEGGPDFPPLKMLTSGKADVTIMWLCSGIQARGRGVKLLNIGQMLQRSAYLLVSKKSGGIRQLSDLEGKSIGIWEGDLGIRVDALLKKHGLRMKTIPQSYSVNLFLRGGVDVASAMLYNEYHVLLDSGLDEDELAIFPLADYGFDIPEDGLYVLEEAYRRDPGRYGDFVQASLEGWRWAFEHEEEALDIVMRYVKKSKVPANRLRQKWMLRRMKELMWTPGGEKTWGRLDPEAYRFAGELMLQYHRISRVPEYATFHPTGPEP